MKWNETYNRVSTKMDLSPRCSCYQASSCYHTETRKFSAAAKVVQGEIWSVSGWNPVPKWELKLAWSPDFFVALEFEVTLTFLVSRVSFILFNRVSTRMDFSPRWFMLPGRDQEVYEFLSSGQVVQDNIWRVSGWNPVPKWKRFCCCFKYIWFLDWVQSASQKSFMDLE